LAGPHRIERGICAGRSVDREIGSTQDLAPGSNAVGPSAVRGYAVCIAAA